MAYLGITIDEIFPKELLKLEKVKCKYKNCKKKIARDPSLSDFCSVSCCRKWTVFKWRESKLSKLSQ